MKTEIAWAAGFFDGEGCTYTHKPSPHRVKTRLVVTNCELEPLERFQRVFGGAGRVYKKTHSKPEHRPGYSLVIYRPTEVLFVLAEMWPYLSGPKKQQANTCVESEKENPKRWSTVWETRRKLYGPSGRKQHK